MRGSFLLSCLASSAAAQSLTEALAGTSDLSTLNDLVKANADLVKALGGASNITVFAPNNDAFKELLASPAGEMIAKNPDAIQATLQYHVAQGTYPSSALPDKAAFVPTLLDNPEYSNVTGGQVVEAVKSGDGVTLFSGLLMNSTVVKANVNFTGGVIHIIDRVLTPPMNISTTAAAANLTAIAAALTATKLVDTVDTLKDVTVFVPSNEAFAAINDTISKLSVDDITKILKYHVIQGTVGYSTSLANGTTAQTVNGANVTITIKDDAVYVNKAKVIKADVLVANGVVHVIDNVLNPSSPSETPDASGTAGSPSYPTGTGGAAGASSTPNAAVPMATGGVAMAALLGVGAAFLNA